MMSGYDHTAGMSNNAVNAYEAGLLPASKIPGIPAILIEEFCRYAEWHHSSKFYNQTKFYNEEYVLATFGLIEHKDYPVDSQAVLQLAIYRIAAKDGPVMKITKTGQTVEWIEWGGTRSRPIPTMRKEQNCSVSMKGQTATVTFPSGKTMVKRYWTNGFKFYSENEDNF